MPHSLSRAEAMTRALSAQSAMIADELTPEEATRLLEEPFWDWTPVERKNLEQVAKREPDAVYAKRTIDFLPCKETRNKAKTIIDDLTPEHANDCLITGLYVDAHGRVHFLSDLMIDRLKTKASALPKSYSPLFQPKQPDLDYDAIQPISKEEWRQAKAQARAAQDQDQAQAQAIALAREAAQAQAQVQAQAQAQVVARAREAIQRAQAIPQAPKFFFPRDQPKLQGQAIEAKLQGQAIEAPQVKRHQVEPLPLDQCD